MLRNAHVQRSETLFDNIHNLGGDIDDIRVLNIKIISKVGL